MRPYIALRRMLAANGITHEYAARYIGKSSKSFSERINRKSEWHLDEAYALLKLLQIDSKYLCKYFPPDDREEVDRREVA